MAPTLTNSTVKPVVKTVGINPQNHHHFSKQLVSNRHQLLWVKARLPVITRTNTTPLNSLKRHQIAYTLKGSSENRLKTLNTTSPILCQRHQQQTVKVAEDSC